MIIMIKIIIKYVSLWYKVNHFFLLLNRVRLILKRLNTKKKVRKEFCHFNNCFLIMMKGF